MKTEIKIGQRFDVCEFIYDDQDQINHKIIRTGWQAVTKGGIGFPSIIGLDGLYHTCWSDELRKVGTLVIKTLKQEKI